MALWISLVCLCYRLRCAELSLRLESYVPSHSLSPFNQHVSSRLTMLPPNLHSSLSNVFGPSSAHSYTSYPHRSITVSPPGSTSLTAQSPNSTRASPFHVCILFASYGGSGSFPGRAVIFDTPDSTSPTPFPPCKVDAKLTKGIGLACHILWARKIKETNAEAITSAGRKEESRVPWQGFIL